MKIRILSVAALSLALAACGGAPEAEGEATEAAATEAAPAGAAPAAAAAAGAAPTKEFMVGSWGESGDCALAIEFKADGSMVGPFDKWELDDKGVLTMVGNDQKMHLTVVDDKTMESRIGGTGDPRKLTRC